MKVITFYESTACLLLTENENSSDYLDYLFINKYHCENFMTLEELKEKANEFALMNGVTEYKFNHSQFKEVMKNEI
jgi:hypothetical protein